MVGNNAEPGTGTQHYTEATNNPKQLADRRFDATDEPLDDRDIQALRTYTFDDRTWVCGQEYFDTETTELFELVAVVRKSPWCSTKPPEEGQLIFQFVGDRYGEMTYYPNGPEEDPTERFVERYQAPAPLGAPWL